jgi:hypothetical protein
MRDLWKGDLGEVGMLDREGGPRISSMPTRPGELLGERQPISARVGMAPMEPGPAVIESVVL